MVPIRQITHAVQRRSWLLVTTIVVLGAALRWYNLTEWDMWLDEVDTLWIAESGEYTEGPMYRTAPVNFWLTAASIRVFGANEFGGRFPSFLAGVLTLLLFFVTFRAVLGDRAAILGMLFLCLSMWHIFWSQVGRHFGPLTLFLLLGLSFLLAHWQRRTAYLAWLAAASVGAALATHSSAFFFLAAIVAVLGFGFLASLLGWSERPSGDYLRAGVPFLILMIAYLPVLFTVGQYILEVKTAWNPPYGILASYLFYVPPFVVFLALAGFLVLVKRRDELAWLLAGLIVVPFALLVFSTTRTLASAAYILASIIAVAALVGVTADWLLDTGSRATFRWAAVTIVVGIFVAQAWDLAHYYMVYNGLKPRWKDAIAYVEERRQPGESLYASEQWVAEYYLGPHEAGWVGEDELKVAPEPGAWYIAYMSLGPMPYHFSHEYRELSPITRMMTVVPLQYGAKNRDLVVFYAEP